MLKSMTIALLALPALATGAYGAESGQHGRISVSLSGAQEDPTVITDARGTAVLRIQGNTVAFNVRFRDLATDIVQAHIHIGARDTTGGISAFLCSNLDDRPSGTALCPTGRTGQITGVIEAADVIGPLDQGVPPTAIADLIKALRGGLAYVNIHTINSPMGEIRGDIPRHNSGG